MFTDEQKDGSTELAFKYAVYRINKDRMLLPNSTLVYDIQHVPRDDSFRAAKKGITMDAEKGGGSSFYEAMVQTSVLGHERSTKPWLLIAWLFPYTSNGRATERVHKQIFSFTDSIVEKRLKEHSNKKKQPHVAKPVTEEGRRKIRTLLELLIESAESEGAAMSFQEIKDELTTIAASGFDTTAISLSNLCLLIGLNPAVQDKISQEQNEIFKGDLRPATANDITRMEYLERVIKETLRILPVAPAIIREISEDITLPSGQILPAGCTTFTYSYMVHRDPRYFPDPERFVPDRWLPDPTGTMAKHPYAYLPFSAGSRNCIGQKYAMLQMKSIASSVLRRFTVSHRFKEEDLKLLNVSMVMDFCEGYEMTLTKK